MNLGYEREVFREVFRADTMQTAIHHDAEWEWTLGIYVSVRPVTKQATMM